MARKRRAKADTTPAGVDMEKECATELTELRDAMTALANATGYIPLEDSDENVEVISHAAYVAASVGDDAGTLSRKLRDLAYAMERRLPEDPA
jgi:hypothetical protein